MAKFFLRCWFPGRLAYDAQRLDALVGLNPEPCLPRFLHTADWQIGRQYGSLHPDNAVPLAEARFAVVERLARLATEQQVDAVLVAGDVFDAQTVSDRTIRRLFNALAGFAGPWILIPGNHDAALAESVWTRALRLGAVPGNAHLALEPGVLSFPELGFAALSAPLTQRHTYADLTAWFDAAQTPPGLLRIGLAHGSVQGVLAEDIDSANPIAPDRAERARLDYLALGDWHGCKCINPRTWYSGTPEPDRFKANDAGLALLVELAGEGAEPQVTPVATGQFRWQQLAATLQVGTDLDELLARLAALGAGDVVDLQLQGQIDLAGQQRLQAAIGRAEAQARHLSVDLGQLRLHPTDEDIASLQADGYLGELIAELRQARSGEQAQLAQDALAILTAALS
jgi:DNA repair exonuclease SbcCD nuclease subunit